MNPGDQVTILSPHWHEGIDLGGRVGTIKCTKGYILVDIPDYGEVKCFRSEVKKIKTPECTDDDIGGWFDPETLFDYMPT